VHPDLTAALVWDTRALRHAESPGAREFSDAMNLMRAPEQPAEDLLGRAARGIWAEFSGEPDLAFRCYSELAESGKDDERLLGLCLLCWTDLDLDPARIDQARKEIERLEEAELKARLMMKLVYAAFEYKWDDQLPELLALAKKWAPEDSLLAYAISGQEYSLFGGDFPKSHPGIDEPLTEQRSITSLLGDVASDALKKEIEERGRSPWLLSFSIGSMPLRQPYAAEMQARWAGAIWLRSEVQTQLAVHLLRGGAESPGDYASAVALWALGNGRQVPQVISLAEPHFDESSADFILTSLMRSEVLASGFDDRMIEAAIECWDLISEDTAVHLINRLQPSVTYHPVTKRVAVLYSLLALRALTRWEERLNELSEDQVRAIVFAMAPAVAERLPLSVARRLYQSVLTAEDIEADSLPTVATLMSRVSDMEEFEPVDVVAPQVIVRLARGGSPMVGESELRGVVEKLTSQIKREVEDARKGSGSLKPENPVNTLAWAIVKLEDLPQQTCELVLEIVRDASLPRNMRYDAIKFIATVVYHGVWDLDSQPGLIESMPEAGAEGFFGSYPPSLMEAAKVELAMAGGKVEEYLPSLIALSRDPDTRVRIDASEAAAIGRQHKNHELLESTLLSGLFDPSDKVVQRALFGFTELPPRLGATQKAFGQRLRELFSTRGREVRAAIAGLVGQGSLPEGLLDIKAELTRRAAKDRSFEVREELAGGRPRSRNTTS
jgi:hypothetical protein